VVRCEPKGVLEMGVTGQLPVGQLLSEVLQVTALRIE